MNWLTELRYGTAFVAASESAGLLKFVVPSNGASIDEIDDVAGQIDIVGLVMPESPDEVVALNCVVIVEAAETIVRATFRYRAKSEARLDEIGDTLDNIFTKRDAGMLGSVELIAGQWSSGASLGQDGSQRITRSANYYLTVARPLRNRY
jgi:hypothetical protein